jgi:hypothetical protein
VSGGRCDNSAGQYSIIAPFAAASILVKNILMVTACWSRRLFQEPLCRQPTSSGPASLNQNFMDGKVVLQKLLYDNREAASRLGIAASRQRFFWNEDGDGDLIYVATNQSRCWGTLFDFAGEGAQMFTLMIALSALVGVACSLRFRVFVLVPVSAAIVIAGLMDAVAGHNGASATVLEVISMLVSLQIGYLLAIGAREVILSIHRTRLLRSNKWQESPRANSYRARLR